MLREILSQHKIYARIENNTHTIFCCKFHLSKCIYIKTHTTNDSIRLFTKFRNLSVILLKNLTNFHVKKNLIESIQQSKTKFVSITIRLFIQTDEFFSLLLI